MSALYLAPILDDVVLNDYPPHIGYTVVPHEYKHETPAYYIQTNRVGFRLRFNLEWRESLVTEAMWASLKTIVNKNIVYKFWPFPDKYYGSSFDVKIIGGLNALSVFKYVETGYQGSLILETHNPVVDIPPWLETVLEIEVGVFEDEPEEDEEEDEEADLDLDDSEDLLAGDAEEIFEIKTIRWNPDTTMYMSANNSVFGGVGQMLHVSHTGTLLGTLLNNGGDLSFGTDADFVMGPAGFTVVGTDLYIHTGQVNASGADIVGIVKTKFDGSDWSFFGVAGTADGSEVGVFPNNAYLGGRSTLVYNTLDEHFYLSYETGSHGGIVKFLFDGSFWEYKTWVGEGMLDTESFAWSIRGFCFGNDGDMFVRYTDGVENVLIKTNWAQTVFEKHGHEAPFTGTDGYGPDSNYPDTLVFRNDFIYIANAGDGTSTTSKIIKTKWNGVDWEDYHWLGDWSESGSFLAMDLRFGYFATAPVFMNNIKLVKESAAFP